MKIKKLNSQFSINEYWSVDNWVYFASESIFAHYHKPTVPYKPVKPLFHAEFMDTCPECNSYLSKEMKDMLVFLNHADNN